jgi:hypothetical protein
MTKHPIDMRGCRLDGGFPQLAEKSVIRRQLAGTHE